MHDSEDKEENLVDGTNKLFTQVLDTIRETLMDEDKITDWVSFYEFIAGGVETFIDEAANGNSPRASVSLLITKIIVTSYITAKRAQPEVDFEIFRYMYMNALERSFARLRMVISDYKRMTDDERAAFYKKYTDKKAAGASGS